MLPVWVRGIADLELAFALVLVEGWQYVGLRPVAGDQIEIAVQQPGPHHVEAGLKCDGQVACGRRRAKILLVAHHRDLAIAPAVDRIWPVADWLARKVAAEHLFWF